MKLSVLSIICVFPLYTFAQLAQTLTDDGQGNSIYVPTAGSTSAVAAPAATPTLVYNCLQMPLICENVAAYANDNGGTNGDLPNQQVLLYYDPDNTNKDKRRGVACGCFEHDTCNTATANGKSSGSKVTDIATASPRTNTFTSISPGATNIILAGVNPGTSPRVPLNGIPGRFFGQGTAFSCDEFPAAPFIQGGTNAKTICALSNWRVFQAADPVKGAGKWPLDARSGVNQEQDWQAQAHAFLREILDIGPSKGRNPKKNWNTVYPFVLSTAVESDLTTKAWLVTNGIATKTVTKRDAVSATTTAVDSHTTYVVSGNEYADEMQLRAIALQKRYKGRIQSDRVARSLTTPPARLVARQVSPAAALITPPARLAARQGGAAAPSCTWGYEISGAEDIEVGDLGFDPPLDADLSTPQCSPAGVPLSDLQAVIDTLDGQGDDGYMFDNCCGGGSVSCLQQGTSGLAAVDLCGGTELECIGCAQLANYLQGMASSCNSNGQVGGSQEINEANSLTVSINLNSSG